MLKVAPVFRSVELSTFDQILWHISQHFGGYCPNSVYDPLLHFPHGRYWLPKHQILQVGPQKEVGRG